MSEGNGGSHEHVAAGQPVAPSNAVAANALLVAVRQSADIICDRWSLSVVLAAFLGASRFNDFVLQTGVTGSLLTARLRRLETAGIIMKVPYSRRPVRHEYRLTNMGSEFYAVVVEMVRWEQRWFPDHTNPVFQLVRNRSSQFLLEPPACKACGKPVSARDVTLKISRALLQRMPEKQTVQRRSTIDRGSEPFAKALLGISLDILGDKWSIEIINCAFLRVHRFREFRNHIGIAANILTDRLNRLVGAGFLRRGDARTKMPTPGYWLTEEGLSFYPVLLRMQDWADTWITDRYRSPVALIHRPCGHVLEIG